MSQSSVKMWLIRAYFKDLENYHNGDASAFTRMVGQGGKQFETASPLGWAKHILNCVTVDVLTHHGEEVGRICGQLSKWGLPAEIPQ